MKLTIFNTHKTAGLVAGIFLFILAFTGIFLNHDTWRFLHNITLDYTSQSTYKIQKKSYVVYWKNNTSNEILVGGNRGLFKSDDNGVTYTKSLDANIFALREYKNNLYIATQSGIYTKKINESKWEKILLDGKIVNSINIYNNILIATIDKSSIVKYNLLNNTSTYYDNIQIDKHLLKEDITLSRFIRDIHYGRGLFDGDISLLINDFASIILIILSISGFVLWWFIRNIKTNSNNKIIIKKFVKVHSNILSIIALIPLFLLLVSGIFLDHSSALRSFMKSVTIPNYTLPPVYGTLKSDIWGSDFDGNYFYIGNRYGVFKSKDLKQFEFVSKGFAYKLIRKNDILYVSGMGSKNRILKDSKFEILRNSPHMFKDVININGKSIYFPNKKIKDKFILPKFENSTFYELFLSLHDGTFFASWWVWVNDFVSVLLIILGITGFIRYKRRKKKLI